jgi:hypothetical protein
LVAHPVIILDDYGADDAASDILDDFGRRIEADDRYSSGPVELPHNRRAGYGAVPVGPE